jgi:hypothetical protein
MFVLTGRRRAVKKERLVFTVGSFHVPELLGAYESEHKHKDGQQKGEKKTFRIPVQSSRRRQVSSSASGRGGKKFRAARACDKSAVACWLRSLSALCAVGLGWVIIIRVGLDLKQLKLIYCYNYEILIFKR